MLADEPTANLDRRTGESVIALLEDLCARLGVTVIASTHDPAVAEHATRVLHMSDGRITEEVPNVGSRA